MNYVEEDPVSPTWEEQQAARVKAHEVRVAAELARLPYAGYEQRCEQVCCVCGRKSRCEWGAKQSDYVCPLCRR